MDTGIIIWIVVATALAFDFTNGFHDTANSMATTIATGALKPRMAVALAAVLNFAGAFISLAVAATIAKGIVDQDTVTLATIFGGLIGAILWNLTTWFFGLPSSSSHALIGGVIGATVVVAGWQAVETEGVVAKVIIPAVLSPIDGASWRPTGGAVDVVMRGLDGRRTLEEIVEACGLTPPQVVDGILEALEFGLVSICGTGARPPARDEASVEAVDAVEPGAPLMDFHECLERGRDALRRRDFAGAEALFERALALRPGDRIAHQNLRRLAEIRGRLE